MSIESLIQLLPPPSPGTLAEPRPDWHEIEGRLGSALPEDYRRFVEVFGAGRVDGFLWVYSPCAANRFLNLFDRLGPILQAFDVLQKDPNDSVPFRLFPADSGLLPWGATDNGDFLFWRTAGVPLDWAIVVAEARAPQYANFNVSMTGFLAAILRRDIVCDIFPDNFPTSRHAFDPAAALSAQAHA